MDSIRKELKASAWKSARYFTGTDQDLPINQVYVWLVTEDRKIVIVSKDGKKWQLPGGKPDIEERPIQTAIREVFEETGININKDTARFRFIGYYDITETDTHNQDDEYLQLRYSLGLPYNSDEIHLDTKNEDEEQIEEEQIKYVELVTPSELIHKIPWAKESREMQAALLSLNE